MRKLYFLALLLIVCAFAVSAIPSRVHSTMTNSPSAVSDADLAFMSEAATGGMPKWRWVDWQRAKVGVRL